MLDWNELVRAEGPGVWRTIQRLVQNRADADECLQETFIAALQFSRRKHVECPAALLKRLAVARAMDCLRRRVRQRRRDQNNLIESNVPKSDPAGAMEQAELAAELRAALARLPARSAEVFCLSELEDWSYSDIAREFGLTTSAVGVLIHRTRRRLQELLASCRRKLS
jgi:RNA polymerase sigma-70 factor (ECF subfamily)